MACESGTTMWRTGWASVLHTLQQTQAGVLLVASYTRISRNTVELLQTLRQMQAQGVEVQVTDPMQEQTLQLLTTLSLYRG